MIRTIFAEPYTTGIIIGVLFGVLARLSMLQTDYRQYPTYPHGRIIHISLGIIAAGLGSVAVPSLLDKDYTAITFLSLAAQQFRDVRNMERQSLQQLDQMELVPRGVSYIEGIAMVFEGRNYLVIFSSFVTTLFAIVTGSIGGIIAGVISLLLANFYKKGKSIEHIADVQVGELRMEGPDLYIDNIHIMNVGLQKSREIILDHGIGLLLRPKNANSKSALAHLGQRQAILHDCSTVLGIYRDSGEPSIIPLAKLDKDTGTLGVFLIPQLKDEQRAIAAMKRVPVLENAVKLPRESAAMSGKE